MRRFLHALRLVGMTDWAVYCAYMEMVVDGRLRAIHDSPLHRYIVIQIVSLYRVTMSTGTLKIIATFKIVSMCRPVAAAM